MAGFENTNLKALKCTNWVNLVSDIQYFDNIKTFSNCTALKNLPFKSSASDLSNGGGDGGSDFVLAGDLCSSPEELVPSDWVSESILQKKPE